MIRSINYLLISVAAICSAFVALSASAQTDVSDAARAFMFQGGTVNGPGRIYGPDRRDEATAGMVESFYLPGNGRTYPMSEGGPLICQWIDAHFRELDRVPANPCEVPLPEGDPRFTRPEWARLDPMQHMDVVKSIAFWQFWKSRTPGLAFDEIGDRRVRNLMTLMSDRWRSSERQVSENAVRNPPAEVSEFIEPAWDIYGGRILLMIAQGVFRLEAAPVDLDYDNEPEPVYRATRLWFGFTRTSMAGFPRIDACMPSPGYDSNVTSGIYLLDRDDPTLNRQLIRGGRLNEYDLFAFEGEWFTMNRGAISFLMPDIGWLSRIVRKPPYASPTIMPLLSEANGRGIGILSNICNFNSRNLQPPY